MKLTRVCAWNSKFRQVQMCPESGRTKQIILWKGSWIPIEAKTALFERENEKVSRAVGTKRIISWKRSWIVEGLQTRDVQMKFPIEAKTALLEREHDFEKSPFVSENGHKNDAICAYKYRIISWN